MKRLLNLISFKKKNQIAITSEVSSIISKLLMLDEILFSLKQKLKENPSHENNCDYFCDIKEDLMFFENQINNLLENNDME